MSDPNTMPGAMMQEEKKESQLFLEQHEKWYGTRPEEEYEKAKQFYFDRTNMFKTGVGFFAYEPEVKERDISVAVITDNYKGAEMSKKERKKQKKRKEKLYKAIGDMAWGNYEDEDEQKEIKKVVKGEDSGKEVDKKKVKEARAQYILSSVDRKTVLHDPTKEFISFEEANKAKNGIVGYSEDLKKIDQKLLSPSYYSLNNFVSRFTEISEDLQTMKTILEKERNGTDSYGNGLIQPFQKAKIDFLVGMYDKINNIYKAGLAYCGLKVVRGKLVKSNEEFDEEQYNEAVSSYAAYIESQGFAEKERMRTLLETDVAVCIAQGGVYQGVETELGPVFDTGVNKFLSMLDTPEYQGNIKFNRKLIQDLLSRYINNSKLILAMKRNIEAIDKTQANTLTQVKSFRDGFGNEDFARCVSEMDTYVDIVNLERAKSTNTFYAVTDSLRSL